MAEINSETAVTTTTEVKKESFGAKLKEWGRKKIVGLKRKPQNIALFFLLVTSLIYLLSLNTISPGPVKDFPATSWLGLCIFINTLFSILVFVLFLNSFPKYPKVNKKTGKKSSVNYIMLALVFVFLAVMIVFDVLYYVIMLKTIAGNEPIFFANMSQAQRYKAYWSESFAANPTFNPDNYKSYLLKTFSIVIAHLVFIGITAVLLATLPLYKKLILKINTKKEIADNNIKEVIDTED